MIEIEKRLDKFIPQTYAGQRADKVLAELFPEYSRTVIQRWLRQGLARLGGDVIGQRDLVAGGEHIVLLVPKAPLLHCAAQAIAIDVVYDDAQIIVINKPAGMVVHPGAGNPDGTLLNGLLSFDPGLAGLPRAGIVHRLDKDTSGLMVVGRTEVARLALVKQLQARTVKRRYVAVVNGVMVSGGSIEAPLGRHQRDRRRMAVTERGKPAISHYRVAGRYRAHTLVQVDLETGRTHQIRVHLAHRGYPLVGDPVYGGRQRTPKAASPELLMALRGFRRQALHASHLSLQHPRSQQMMSWEQPLPADMQQLVAELAADHELHTRSVS